MTKKTYHSYLTYSSKEECDHSARIVSNKFHEYHSSYKTEDGWKFSNIYDVNNNNE